MRLRHLRLTTSLVALAGATHPGLALAEVECTPSSASPRRSCDVALMQVAAVLCTQPGPEADAKWNAQVERCAWPEAEQLRERLDSACWTTTTELATKLREDVPSYSCDPQMLVYEAYAELKACGERLECQVQVAPKLMQATRVDLSRSEDDEARTAWRASQGQAVQLLSGLQKKVARITIEVSGGAPKSLVVTLGGEPVKLGEELYVPPGALRLTAKADGHLPEARKLQLRPGDRRSELIELTPRNEKARPVPAPGPRRAPPRPPPAAKNDDQQLATAAWVSLFAGTTAVGVGLVFGALALDKERGAARACPDKSCDEADQRDVETGKTYGSIATWTIGIGGALAAGGGVALWLEPERSTPTEVGRLGLRYRGWF